MLLKIDFNAELLFNTDILCSATCKITYCHGTHYDLWDIQEYIVSGIDTKYYRLYHYQMVRFYLC